MVLVRPELRGIEEEAPPGEAGQRVGGRGGRRRHDRCRLRQHRDVLARHLVEALQFRGAHLGTGQEVRRAPGEAGVHHLAVLPVAVGGGLGEPRQLPVQEVPDRAEVRRVGGVVGEAGDEPEELQPRFAAGALHASRLAAQQPGERSVVLERGDAHAQARARRENLQGHACRRGTRRQGGRGAGLGEQREGMARVPGRGEEGLEDRGDEAVPAAFLGREVPRVDADAHALSSGGRPRPRPNDGRRAGRHPGHRPPRTA